MLNCDATSNMGLESGSKKGLLIKTEEELKKQFPSKKGTFHQFEELHFPSKTPF